MYPVQATEAAQWADQRYREELARAGRERLPGRPARIRRAKVSARGLIAHPMRVAAVVSLLVAILVVATV